MYSNNIQTEIFTTFLFEKKTKKVILHKTWNTAVKPPGRGKKNKQTKKKTKQKTRYQDIKEQSGSRFKVQSDQYSKEEIKGKLKENCMLIIFPVTNVKKNLQKNLRHNTLHQECDYTYTMKRKTTCRRTNPKNVMI